ERFRLPRLDELLFELALGSDVDQRTDPCVRRVRGADALVDDVDDAAVAPSPAVVRGDGALAGLCHPFLERLGIAADYAVAPAQLARGQRAGVLSREQFEIATDEAAVEASFLVEARLVERQRQGFEDRRLPQPRLLQLALDREPLGIGVEL